MIHLIWKASTHGGVEDNLSVFELILGAKKNNRADKAYAKPSDTQTDECIFTHF